ncbi:MAG: anaerobic dimethyl sulfoxide reductase subunit [Clostridiales bacterium]|nr:anaerobic dimethyl sulfoxide reductase subunit [Clostridiales bacterium]
MKDCIGCRACMIACKDEHQLPLGIMLRQVREVELSLSTKVQVDYESVACRQCKEAACIRVCPTKALFYQMDGTVSYCRDKCVGCGACVRVCPDQEIFQEEKRGRIFKCDTCYNRRQAGYLPVCVEACPTRCLTFEIEEGGAFKWNK